MPQCDQTSLDRFTQAQEPVIDGVMQELRAGRKRSHWMWFIFPQMRGLGQSATAKFYGIASLDEARAYLAHPVLGPRLEDCTRAVLAIERRTLRDIFGSPDDVKYCSSMTLFVIAAGNNDTLFRSALARHCDGRMDDRTLALLPDLSWQVGHRPGGRPATG